MTFKRPLFLSKGFFLEFDKSRKDKICFYEYILKTYGQYPQLTSNILRMFKIKKEK